MSTISLQQAQETLADVVHRLAPGDGVTITENDRPVARLVALSSTEAPSPVFGRCAGMMTIVDDDDEHLAHGEPAPFTGDGGAVVRPMPAIVPRNPPRPRPPVTGVPKAGNLEGRLFVPVDFKEPLEEMREYME